MSQYSDNKFYNSDNHAWGLVYSFVEPKSMVLDVGCSSGTLGQVLIKQKGCTVDGIETVHEDAIKASRKLRKVYELNVETGDLSVVKGKYDVIIFADVIEHLVDPVKTLKKIQKYLKKGGVIIFSIPNMAHVSIRLSLLEGKFDYTETGLLDKTHLHFYTYRQIMRTFSEAGLKIIHQKYTHVVYPKQYLVKRLEAIGLQLKSDRVIKTLTEDVDSQAFQYIGVAIPNSEPIESNNIHNLPHIEDAKEIESYIDDLKHQVTKQTAQIEQQKSQISALDTEISTMQAENRKLGYRLVRKIYHLINLHSKKQGS